MTGFTYVVGVDMDGESGLTRLMSIFDKLDGTVNKIQGSIDSLGEKIDEMGQSGSRSMQGMKSGLNVMLKRLVAVVGVTDSIVQSLKMEGIESRLQRITGQGKTNVAMVESEADRLGISVQSAIGNFDKLAGSMGRLPGGKLEETFKGFLTASRAMSRTDEETNSLFASITKLGEKGVISVSDFQKEVESKLPGAFGIAARSMGISENQLIRWMNEGRIMADDLLPAMGMQLQKELGEKAEEAAGLANSSFARLSNFVLSLRAAVGDELLSVLQPLMDNYLIPAVKWLRDHVELIGLVAAMIGGWYVQGKLVIGMINVWTGLQKAWNAITVVSSAVTTLFTGGIRALNLAMLANPIGIVIGLLGALVVGVMYAWNKFDGFRGFIVGTWEVIKTLGNVLKEFLIEPFMAIGNLIAGVFSGNKDLIASGIEKATNVVKRLSNMSELGKELGESYRSGFQKGIESDFEFSLFKGFGNELSPNFDPDTTSGGDSGKNFGNKTKKGVSEIIGGGGKNITINVGKLIENLNFHTSGNMNEITNKMKDEATKVLLEVLNSANQVQLN